MSVQNIVIIEKDAAFALLLKSALESYGLNNVDVVRTKDEASAGVIILSEENDVFLQKPIFFGRLLENLDLIANRDEKAALVELGPFSLDLITNILMSPAGKSIKITEKERDILLFLQEQAPATVSKQELLEHVWGYGDGINTHTLETHIYRLRQKIEDNASEPKYLKTDDEGYRLEM